MTSGPADDLPTQIEALIEALPGDEPKDWGKDWSHDQFSLIKRLGHGGMGQVFLARQHHPVERDVALKVIHHKVSNPLNRARFELERQTLARMSHPAIAQVFDAGTTPSGYPWFAMEYIEGERLDHYCAGRRLPIKARLELFVRICRGVQHAHQKGVIHRDLKPGNILVTEIDGEAMPRIIDFGIATSNDSGQENTGIGTPQYMSPEQLDPARGDIDTRSDVYSLGVILHELLVDQPPLGRSLYQERDTTTLAARLVASQPLPAPSMTLSRGSARAARLAERRRMRPGSLRRSLRGDLDAITLKALAVDKDQRYASAGDLAADIERALGHHPVMARPATGWYRSRRFARRHALALGSASLITLALLVGLGAALFGMLEAQRQFELAQQRQTELVQVSAFQQSMLEGIDLQSMGSGLISALREQTDLTDDGEALLSQLRAPDLARGLVADHILEPAWDTIVAEFSGQPLLKADLLESLWQVHHAMGSIEPQVALARRVLELRTDHLEPTDRLRLRAQQHLGQALYANGQFDPAVELFEELVTQLAELDGEDYFRDRISAQTSLGNVLVDSRATSRATALADDTLEEARLRLDPLDEHYLDALAGRGYVRIRSGNIEGALHDYLALADGRGQILEAGDRRLIQARMNIGGILGALGRHDEALAMDQETLDLIERHLGRNHPHAHRIMNNIAAHLIHLDRLDEAVDLLEQTVQLRTESLGALHPDTLRTQLNLGSLSIRLNAFEQAERLIAKVLDERRRLLGYTHRDTLHAKELLADVLIKQGRADEALPLAEIAYRERRSQMGERHALTGVAANYLGQALLELDRPDDALPMITLSAEISRDSLTEDHRGRLRRHLTLYQVLGRLGECEKAGAVRDQHLTLLESSAADEAGSLAGLRDDLRQTEHCTS